MQPTGSQNLRKNQPEEGLAGHEFQALAADLRRAFVGGEPAGEFRSVLHSRLVAEARQLYSKPVQQERRSLLRRAVVGAAAVSVASVAVVLWRSRLASSLLSQRPVPAIHGAR